MSDEEATKPAAPRGNNAAPSSQSNPKSKYQANNNSFEYSDDETDEALPGQVDSPARHSPPSQSIGKSNSTKQPLGGRMSVYDDSELTLNTGGDTGMGFGQLVKHRLSVTQSGLNDSQPAKSTTSNNNALTESQVQQEEVDKLNAEPAAPRAPVVNIDIPTAIKLTQRHPRMFSHQHGKLEKTCEDYVKKFQKQEEEMMPLLRVYSDEYAKLCVTHRSLCAPPNLHAQFVSTMEDFQMLCRFEITGVSERMNNVKSRITNVHKEAFKRLQQVAMSILRNKVAPGVVKCSSRTYLDETHGLVIQRYPTPGLAKRRCKALLRFSNLALNSFVSPMMIVAEVLGVTFSCTSLAPIEQVIKDPYKQAQVRLHIELALCEMRLPIDWERIYTDCTFARGLDGRYYCLHAYGAIPEKYSPSFLHLFPGNPADVKALDALLTKNLDRAANEIVAGARANFTKASKVLHKHGMRVSSLQYLHAHLSKQERIRENTVGAVEDTNLVAALISVVAEVLARTLKVVLRQYWEENLATKASEMSDEGLCEELAASAHQLVDALIIENHHSRQSVSDQLYHRIVKISYLLFPKDVSVKEKDLIWEERFISEAHIAKRVAHMTGLNYYKGVIAGTAVSRFVRCISFALPDDRLGVICGKHQDVLKRLVNNIKFMKPILPEYTFHLTVLLADSFHQSTGRSSVTRTPAELFAQTLRMEEIKREDGTVITADQQDMLADDPYLVARQMELLRVVALQAVFREGGKQGLLAAQQEAAPATQRHTVGGTQATPPDGTPEAHSLAQQQQKPLIGGGGKRASRVHEEAHEIQAALALKRHGAVDVAAVLKAVNRYVNVNINQSKDSSGSSKEAILLTTNRAGVVYHFCRYFAEGRQTQAFLEQALSSLDTLRRQNELDVKLGIHHWLQLQDAIIEQEAVKTGVGTKLYDVMQKKVDFIDSVFGGGTLQVAAAHNDIGAVLLRLGELPNGRRHFEIAFRLLQDVAPHNPSTFAAANNLGCTYFRLADNAVDQTWKKRRWSFLKFTLPANVDRLLKEAEEAFKFVLDNRRYVEPETIADVVNNLGSILVYRGKCGSAIKYFEESLLLTRGLYADTAPERQNPIRNLKHCHKRLLSSASLWIACFWKRVKAKRELKLRKNANEHVWLFQRMGRGYLNRMRLFTEYERNQIRNIGKGNLFDAGISGSFAIDGMTSFEVGKSGAYGNSNAKPATNIVMPLFDDDDDDEDIREAEEARRREEEEQRRRKAEEAKRSQEDAKKSGPVVRRKTEKTTSGDADAKRAEEKSSEKDDGGLKHQPEKAEDDGNNNDDNGRATPPGFVKMDDDEHRELQQDDGKKKQSTGQTTTSVALSFAQSEAKETRQDDDDDIKMSFLNESTAVEEAASAQRKTELSEEEKEKERVTLCQRVGRAMLIRVMLHPLWLHKQRKAKAKAKREKN